MICARCKTENPAEAKFCMSCGSEILPYCAECDMELPAGAEFCHLCGRKLGADPAAHAVVHSSSATPAPAALAAPDRVTQYIPDGLKGKLESARSTGGMEGERRVVTMLFCDVQGSTAAAEQLRVAYNRKAYREVYDDPQSAEPLLRASLELADLDTNQRELLGEAALTYRGVYHRLSERMVEATEAGRTSTTNPRGADWQRWADRRNTLDRLRYDRDELSEKFRRRIQTILSEEQHARIAGERETG